MTSQRVIFRSKGAAPAAAPVARLPVLFVIKAITPAPELLEPLPETDHGHDFNRPVSGLQFELIAKALHDGRVSVSDAVRASDAYMGGRPLPHDLIGVVLEGSR